MTRKIYGYPLSDILNGVNGWLFDNEADMLMRYASRVQHPNCIVEIGSYQGRSLLCLCKGAGENIKIFSIDPRHTWEGEAFQFSNMDRVFMEAHLAKWEVQDKVYPITLEGAETGWAWRSGEYPPVGMIFIDGDHRENRVLSDILAWIDSVITEGYIVFHDSNTSGVINAIRRFNESSRQPYILQSVETQDITEVFQLRKKD